MGKSCSYKRRLRRLQKKRKRIKSKESEGCVNSKPAIANSTTNIESNKEVIITAGDTIVNIEEAEEGEGSRSSLNYKKKFKEAVQYAKLCESQIKNLETDMLRLEGDCEKKIRNVRYFWKDMIYGEGTRPGRILKAAMLASCRT